MISKIMIYYVLLKAMKVKSISTQQSEKKCPRLKAFLCLVLIEVRTGADFLNILRIFMNESFF